MYREHTANCAGQVVMFRKGLSRNMKVEHDSQRIFVVKVDLGGKQLAVVNMFAPKTTKYKLSLFDMLVGVMRNVHVNDTVMCGDFNCVLDNDCDEKHAESTVLKFNTVLHNCDLHDTWRLLNP